jgi:membrane-associated phospholipid phosphatase
MILFFGPIYYLTTLDFAGLVFLLFVFVNMFVNMVVKGFVKIYLEWMGMKKSYLARPGAYHGGCGDVYVCGYKNKEILPGWPSGHSQLVMFFATFWSMYMLRNFETSGAYATPAVLYPLAGLVCWSRIYIKCHNWIQVVAGGFLGYGMGVLAYYIYSQLVERETFRDFSYVVVLNLILTAVTLSGVGILNLTCN